jgi:uncharacterized membrane protein
MTFVLVFAGIFLLTMALSGPWFETAVIFSLLIPIVAFGTHATTPLGYVLVAGGVLLGASLIVGIRSSWPSSGEFATVGAFLLLFSVLLVVAHWWGDFENIAERPRDLAVLGSTFRNPITIEEPWFAGHSMNYYSFWYRYGRMLGVLSGNDVRDTYHALIAIPLALLCVATFRFLTIIVDVRPLSSALISIVVTWGSNVDGFLWLKKSGTAWQDFFRSPFSMVDEWWSPSRVIVGGINEFPAWSFILGDAHPHFLSVGLCPVFLTIGGLLIRSDLRNNVMRVAALGVFVMVTTLFYANANPWDVPLWLLIVLPFLGFHLNGADFVLRVPREGVRLALVRSGLLLLSALLLTLVMGAALNQIAPVGDYPIRFVSESEHRTTLSEILRHFGVPLVALCIAVVCGFQTRWAQVGAAVLLSSTLLSPRALPFLSALLGVGILLLIERYKKNKKEVTYLLALGGVALVVVAEMIFLDDPYGGENERMNTIFKIHNYAWFPLMAGSLGALVTVSKDREKWMRNATRGSLIALLFLTSFFIRSAYALRPNSTGAYSDGLNKAEQLFPGAREAIHFLQSLPRQIVLEAQGPPYSFTAHVASFSGQPSYLGWENHVRLFSLEHSEIQARVEKTALLYSELSCEERRRLLREEHITVLVRGPLERKQYSLSSDFSCLKILLHAGEYDLYSP